MFALYVMVVDLMRGEQDQSSWIICVLLLSAIAPLLLGLYQYPTADTGNHETFGLNRIQGTFQRTRRRIRPTLCNSCRSRSCFFVIHTRSKLSRVGLSVYMIPVIIFSIYATQTRGAWLGVWSR